MVIRIFIPMLIFVCLIISCRNQNPKRESLLETNRFAKDSFLLATKLVDTNDKSGVSLIDGMTAIIVPERMGDEDFVLKDDTKFGFEMPCQCAFKDDTLSVVSALAWEGGFAYIAHASEKQSLNSLKLFGKNKQWELSGKKYKDEINITSSTNKMVISKAFPLKEGETIYGWFDIRTPEFFEIKEGVEEKESQQHILRIYFSCQVWPETIL